MQPAEHDTSVEQLRDDPERAIRYSRVRELLFLAGLIWQWVSLAYWLRGRRSARMQVLAGRLSPRPYLVTPLYVLGYGLLQWITSLPLTYVSGYVVEHRFGLSNQTHKTWLVDALKALGLSLVLEVPIVSVAYGVIRRSPRWWWLILAGLALPFTVLLAQLFPVLIAPIFNKYERLRDADLAERLKGLAERAGVHVADVFRMDMSRQTRKANAFFAGLGRTKRIALADTLLEHFTPDEIEVVVAHELGHQVNRDVWKLIGVGTLTTLAGAWLLDRVSTPLIRRNRERLGFSSIGQPASLPLLMLLGSVFGVLLMPLQNWFSRRLVEARADDYALQQTRRPDIFIAAMEKLGRVNLSDPSPPFLVKILLHSHPSIAERIQAARAFEQRS
jgi:STE24 endopeptidase